MTYIVLSPSDDPEPSLVEPAAISTAAITPNNLEALVNTERTKAGKQPLVTDSTLRASSCSKAEHMLSQDYWAHTSPDGVTPWTFIEKAGYRYTTAGENLAKAYPDDTSLVAAWMNSPTHRENLLGDFKEQGICQKTGMLQGKATTVTVQHIASKYQEQQLNTENQ
ncbi:CAP domain-containing protein [Rhodococcus qingshengii]|uniref:CAP domain-containing protein n=1 Tax=Rhodococcus TaxID=1827 RepID=UPI0013DE601A|nr:MULTISPECIES: CAP domain-containing protein [Rhodococcus]BDQ20040.1 CAP domain-containing protein [Rhodococcus qingshengii]